MKIKFLFFPLVVILVVSLACTLFVGGPDYSDLPPISASTEDVQSLKDSVKKAFEDGLQSGVVTIAITEQQLTSYLTARLQNDPNLQQDNKPLIADPQAYLRDGQIQIYGKTQQGIFAANIGVIVNVSVDGNGKPKIEIASADFGPFSAPQGVSEALTAAIEEAYTGAFGPVLTGLRVESISIADGVMTISGRIR
ncbi:MAG: hypothetical protein OZ914_04630 [Anaerolineaceae bacterium]|jgi:hypothetical protein|nr:hypothetical protein [Anaerolineaceae bacterium]OQY88516.1 MAG: hypothetical protein B6D38_09110 [Anaerolineae bacterium UTCFX1]